MNTSQNLQLARDLFAYFLEQRSWVLTADNAEIAPLLDGGDEYEVACLPGETVEAVIGNLTKAISLSLKEAPLPTSGRNREVRQTKTRIEREQILLFARVALALIEVENHAPESHDSGAAAVLRGIQAMTTAFLGQP